MKATPVQKKRLAEVERGQLTRSGNRIWYYHMHNTTAITEPMVDRLESNGWIAWHDKTAVLTPAGLRALGRTEVPHV